jgi:hypothetical protein
MLVRSSVRIVASLLIVLTAACQSTGREEPKPNARGALERLQELQPSDVAVAPVLDRTDGQRVPTDLFRRSFVESLIERRYSPLAPGYVDANWIEASFKGTPPPDALLVVSVTAWNPSHLFSNGKVSATAEVLLYEGGDTTGALLWQATLAHVVDLSDGRGTPPAGGTDWIPVAVRKFAQQALQSLPMRDPRAVHATAAVQ